MLVAIVDGYSTGRFLSRRIRDRGYRCVHVQSETNINEFDKSAFVVSDYDLNVVHYNLETTCRELINLNVNRVVAGSESGVELADAIAHTLRLPGNDIALSVARRNKIQMQKAIQGRGLRGPFTLEIASSSQISELWPRDLECGIVVKPIDSAGSDGVHICKTIDDAEMAALSLLGKTNAMGKINKSLVVQELLVGTQYIVNTVSCNGSHHVTEVWIDHREYVEHGVAYSYEQLLDTVSPEKELLTQYAVGVLDALGVREGPAHHEIILTQNGPSLVEVGCRLQGSIDPCVIERAIGYSHVTSAVDAIIEPQIGAEHFKLKDDYSIVRCVSLISNKGGRIVSQKNIDKILKLSSLDSIYSMLSRDDELKPTVDISTSPGVIYLANRDLKKLEEDYKMIRHIESTEGFFTLSESEGY